MFSGCSKKNKNSEEQHEEQTSLVVLSETTISIPEERTHKLNATIDESLANYLRFWSSENEKIATVNDEGLVTAVSKGSTIIVLQCGKYFARCAVEVTDYVPNDALSVSLTKESYILNVGDEYTINPTIKLGETKIESGYTVAADSSDESVATFSVSSLAINAVGSGNCDILLTFTYQEFAVEQLIYVTVY